VLLLRRIFWHAERLFPFRSPIMRRLLTATPLFITLSACLLMLWHGPIAQLAHYHDFADQRILLGVPHALDVLSNLGFAMVGLWGLWRLRDQGHHPRLSSGFAGYRLMWLGLILVACGSAFYHVAPSDARLIWDRLPIALVCAGMLAAVRAETVLAARQNRHALNQRAVSAAPATVWLALLAVASVLWWVGTGQHGQGDLRPYLLLQTLPLVLIPLWQAIYRAPAADRIAFATAMLCYVLAKLCELHDQQILALLGVISGHTLKHALATLAMGLITAHLIGRTRERLPHYPRLMTSPGGHMPLFGLSRY
jgi:hypothetical protein